MRTVKGFTCENTSGSTASKTASRLLYTGQLLFFALLLSACNGKEEQAEATPEPVENAIVLSADGVGPLNGSSSFNMHQMTVAFSDYSVEEVINFQNKAPYPVIRISRQGHTIMVVNPDAARQSVFSIVIEDNSVRNSLGHPLGMPYSDVYTFGHSEKCQPGNEELAGRVLCYAPGSPNILYAFNGPWDGQDGQMPTGEILQNWVIESIIWRPKS